MAPLMVAPVTATSVSCSRAVHVPVVSQMRSVAGVPIASFPRAEARPCRRMLLGARAAAETTEAVKPCCQGKATKVAPAEVGPAPVEYDYTATVQAGRYIPPPPSNGNPVLWVGLGVGLAVAFFKGMDMVQGKQKSFQQMMMEQMMKNMAAGGGGMGGMPGATPGSNPFAAGGGFPFPPPPTTPSPSAQPSAPYDPFKSATPASASSTTSAPSSTASSSTASSSTASGTSTRKKTSSFADVTVDEVENAKGKIFEETKRQESEKKKKTAYFADAEVINDGTAGGKAKSGITIEALEKMMEDPVVQRMVYPHLPEEMRNPATFKWMLQNPEYRRQLESMLENMGGNMEWDSRMTEMMKNFDLSSPEIKQQFDAMGMTPEDVIAKIMANPDVAQAFQNPKVQAAIMDCSTNPMNITKYQNDPEIMNVFMKITELFPQMG